MDQNVSPLQRIINELECLFEVGSHFITWYVEGVDDFMINIVLFRIINIEHGT
jgi:hypothetical protein